MKNQMVNEALKKADVKKNIILKKIGKPLQKQKQHCRK